MKNATRIILASILLLLMSAGLLNAQEPGNGDSILRGKAFGGEGIKYNVFVRNGIAYGYVTHFPVEFSTVLDSFRHELNPDEMALLNDFTSYMKSAEASKEQLPAYPYFLRTEDDEIEFLYIEAADPKNPDFYIIRHYRNDAEIRKFLNLLSGMSIGVTYINERFLATGSPAKDDYYPLRGQRIGNMIGDLFSRIDSKPESVLDMVYLAYNEGNTWNDKYFSETYIAEGWATYFRLDYGESGTSKVDPEEIRLGYFVNKEIGPDSETTVQSVIQESERFDRRALSRLDGAMHPTYLEVLMVRKRKSINYIFQECWTEESASLISEMNNLVWGEDISLVPYHAWRSKEDVGDHEDMFNRLYCIHPNTYSKILNHYMRR